MTKQIVNIVNFNSLYEILNEIKENLSFDIMNFEMHKDFFKNEKNDLKDFLTITNSNKKKLIYKNLLIFNNLPIPLYTLVELININLIKLKFNY